MNAFTREFVETLRSQYPPGSRITLNHMNDPYHPVESGTTGTLKHIDDAGTLHVAWDNGRTLGLIYGEDSFEITAPVTKDNPGTLDARLQTAEREKSAAMLTQPEHPTFPEQ